jgi:uncharacterized membrane protein YdbT with pleckstrin-like domain
MPFFLTLPGIEIFALFGMLVGACLFLLALFLSLSYRYVVTEDSLRKEYFFFATSREEVPLDSVTNVVVYQDIVGKALGFGTVRADTAGTAYMGISFIGVEDPYCCAETIRKAVRNARKRRRSKPNDGDEKYDPTGVAEIERIVSETVERKLNEVKDEIACLINESSLKSRSHIGSMTRKNERVVYIPRQPLYDYVLDRLRRSQDESLRETVRRVFCFAADHLGWK